MKKISEIRKAKPEYFVAIDDVVEFESESITECKNYLCSYIKEHKSEIENEGNYYIGMFNIDIE